MTKKIIVLGWTCIVVSGVSYLLARIAKESSSSKLLLNISTTLFFIAGLLLLLAAIKANISSSKSGLMHGYRRRLLGFSISVLLTGILIFPQILNSVDNWIKQNLSNTTFSIQEFESIASFVLFLTVPLTICGSFRWLFIGVLSFFALAFLHQWDANIGQIGLWVFVIGWLIGVAFLCPKCGALFKYSLRSSTLLNSSQRISWEAKNSSNQVDISNNIGQTIGQLNFNTQHYVPVTRTSETRRNKWRCSKCQYATENVSTSVS
jgi:hypothetical protein